MAQQAKRISYFTVILYTLTRGRFPRGSAADPVGILDLTSTGRKSGQLRTVSLVYFKSDAAYVVTASNGGGAKNPGWYYNVRANPQVTMHVHNQTIAATAEVVSPAQRPQLWARLVEVAPMFAGYEKRTQREIPMVFLRPNVAAEG